MKTEMLFTESRKTYGYRKMQRALAQSGTKISVYCVRKIMRENGFYPETITKYRPYHYGKQSGQYSPNLLKQNFRAEKADKVWVGDITYIKTTLGWVYLAAVIDLYNREVIGYSVSKQIDTELVKRALGNAIGGRENLSGLVFHGDRGCQYSSQGYRHMLEEHGIVSSMSRPGCSYDNSCLEIFFATLKKECIYRRRYVTMEEVRRDMFSYMELFYNRKRMHSVLGYLSPVAYRRKNQGGEAA
ncbi:MAG: hypothetical protein CVU91_12145 [Firmicutes bacterium HGW-Firmicutes-16]|nr:MAG: hypothetical protein CVU91_12145 [Firmicutes bacterium HGW-Firmicutes-16]